MQYESCNFFSPRILKNSILQRCFLTRTTSSLQIRTKIARPRIKYMKNFYQSTPYNPFLTPILHMPVLIPTLGPQIQNANTRQPPQTFVLFLDFLSGKKTLFFSPACKSSDFFVNAQKKKRKKRSVALLVQH